VVDVKDSEAEVDDEDWDRLGNEDSLVLVEAEVLVAEEPVIADDPDDAIVNIGEKFDWVGFVSSMISIV
jgi:hypothetical protein